MPRITRTTFVAAHPDLVWDLAQDFGQWHPRLNIYVGGPETSAELVVTVLEQDDATRTLSYTMPEPPFPITDHKATITVTPYREDNCHVEWSAEFETDPGIMQLLEDQLGDDIFKIALDRLAEAAHAKWTPPVPA